MNSSIIWTVLYFVAIIAIVYFLLIRPNQKKEKARRAMIDSLITGVKIISYGGIHGEVTRIKDDTIWMKISNNVEIELEKSHVVRVLS